MAAPIARPVLRTAEKTFLQKWIFEAKPGWPILFLAPWSTALAFYIGYQKMVVDNTFFWNKNIRYMQEENKAYDILANGRGNVETFVQKKRAAYGVQGSPAWGDKKDE